MRVYPTPTHLRPTDTPDNWCKQDGGLNYPEDVSRRRARIVKALEEMRDAGLYVNILDSDYETYFSPNAIEGAMSIFRSEVNHLPDHLAGVLERTSRCIPPGWLTPKAPDAVWHTTPTRSTLTL